MSWPPPRPIDYAADMVEGDGATFAVIVRSRAGAVRECSLTTIVG